MSTLRTFTYYCFLLVSLLWTNIVQAQDATVQVRANTQRITVGDQAQVFLELKLDAAQSKAQWAAIPDTFNTLEVIEKGKIDTVQQGGITTYTQRLLVTGFDSGEYAVPAFIFTIIPNTGSAYTIQSNTVQLLVETVPVDTSKAFKGIKGIREDPTTWEDKIKQLATDGRVQAAGVLLLILLIVIIYLLRRKKKPAPPPSPTRQETLQEWALRELATVDKKQLWQEQQVKEYYSELTDVVRSYIEKRFQTPAMELTTDELLQTARTNKDMREHYELLSRILYTADLAKFARAEPTADEHTATMQQATQFVRDTPPPPATSPQNPAA